MRYQIYVILCLRYISVIFLRTHRYITEVFYFFTGFTTAYNMLWKKKLFLQLHNLKKKLIHHIFVKKKRNPGKARGKRVNEEHDKELENNDHDDPGISDTIFPEDY